MNTKWLKCKIWDPIETFFYNVRNGVENIKNWLHIIWEDRNWDHYYIYVVLRHKLHLMEKNIRENGCHVNANKDADNIKVCVNLLDRLIADDYHEMAFKKHDEKWGDIELRTKPSEKYKDLYSVDVHRDNIKTKEDEELERKEFKKACEHETYLREQDLDLLFKNMRKYIQTWWD